MRSVTIWSLMKSIISLCRMEDIAIPIIGIPMGGFGSKIILKIVLFIGLSRMINGLLIL